MTFTSSFLTGVCERLATLGAPYEYKTGTEVFTDNAAAISWELEPDLEKVVMVRAYPVADDIALSDSVVGVQFKISGPGDLAFVNKATDDLFDLFHGMHGATLGSVKVVQAERRSGASLGQDGSGRVSRSENYYFTVHRPSSNRT